MVGLKQMKETKAKTDLYALICATEIDSAAAPVKRALQAIRSHLGMHAYISEFVNDRAVLREIDAPGQEVLINVGDSYSLADVDYCHIIERRLPEIIPDMSREPLAKAVPISKAISCGARVSVPILLPDGRLYGMFCCLRFEADHSLNQRDLQMMKAFAELTGFEIHTALETAKATAAKLAHVSDKLARIRGVIEEGQLSVVYQPIWNVGGPIWDITSGRPVGVECLARFSAIPLRSPNLWFADAAEVGLGALLEIAAIKKALSVLPLYPGDVYLAVNVSPATIVRSEFLQILDGMPMERIVLELTEHASVDNYTALLAVLQPLRQQGLRVAVDDAGAGYCSLQHILHMHPEIIKLDVSLTRNINLDPARRALTSALMEFARETGSRIVAEGVETEGELATLKLLGIDRAQGHFLARPMAFESAAKLFARRSATPASRPDIGHACFDPGATMVLHPH